ncbi:hypothetical protein D3C87_2152950 [compost metagenome]
MSFSSLFTYIASNTTPKNAKNLFLLNSSFARNLALTPDVATISGGSIYDL